MKSARVLVLAAWGVAACAHSGGRVIYQQSRDVLAVALAGQIVYAWRAGELVAWDMSEPAARPIGLGRPVALAEDGSMAVTATPDGGGTRLDVWALGTRARAFTRTFGDGVDRILGVSRVSVALVVKYPKRVEPFPAAESMPPPVSYPAIWKLASNTVTRVSLPEFCDRERFAMSADGERSASACGGVAWSDAGKRRTRFADLSMDWEPSTRPADESTFKEKPRYEPYHHDILSLRLAPGGSDVYVTYRGPDAGTAWRLERWTPEAPRGGEPHWGDGSITRLASTDQGRGRLLAASADGSLLVLGDDGAALTLRRAPRYDPERLGGDAMTVTATAAALSPDGNRLVTGHADGRLVLWDLGTGRQLATASPPGLKRLPAP